MTRPGYKMTEIGEIPSDWEVSKLGDLCELLRNGLTSNQESDGIPVTRIETISKGEFGDKFGHVNGLPDDLVSAYRLKKGDVLMSHINSIENIGKSAIYRGKPELILHGMNLLLLRFDAKKGNPFFYIQCLKWNPLLEKIRTLAKKAVNQASINQTELSRVLISVPPLMEQQKIAEILSTADDAIQRVDEQITLSEHLKKGLMQTLLTKGIGHTKFKMTEIGEIPEEWVVEKIAKLSKIVTGGTPYTSEPKYWDGEIPWVASGDVHQQFIKRAGKFITKEGYSNSNCKLLPIGTVLVALNGQGKTRGLSAILEFEATCNQSLAGIISNKNVLNPLYLLYHLLSRYAYIRNISGIGRNGLNLDHIRNLVISCPPIVEQQKIAEILLTVDKKLEHLKGRRDHLEKLKKVLTNDLLTGKVRVKIEPSGGEN